MFDSELSFNYFDYEALSKDFCYNKPFVLSYKASNSTTQCQLEEEIQFKSNKCVLQDKIRVQRSLGKSGNLKLTSSLNSFKLFYTHILPKQAKQAQGEATSEQKNPVPQQKEQVKAYAGTFTDRKLQNASLQLGFQRSTPSTYINANVTNFIFKHKNQYFLYAKMLYLASKFKIGFLSVFDFSSHNLQTNDLVFEWKPHLNHQLFFRGQVNGLRNYSLNYKVPKSYFDFLGFNYIFKPTQSLTMMAQLKYNIETNRLQKMESLIEKTFDDRKLKFCLNHFGDITMQVGVPLSLGKNSRLDFGLLLSDIMKSRKISYGFKVAINS